MRFRIYYDDGSVYSDNPLCAPATGIQVVTQEALNDKGFSLQHGKDAFCWKDDLGWVGTDMAGMWDYLMVYCGPKGVLFGRTIRDEKFWKIVERASQEGLG